jgi:hypothetical protein
VKNKKIFGFTNPNYEISIKKALKVIRNTYQGKYIANVVRLNINKHYVRQNRYRFQKFDIVDIAVKISCNKTLKALQLFWLTKTYLNQFEPAKVHSTYYFKKPGLKENLRHPKIGQSRNIGLDIVRTSGSKAYMLFRII